MSRLSNSIPQDDLDSQYPSASSRLEGIETRGDRRRDSRRPWPMSRSESSLKIYRLRQQALILRKQIADAGLRLESIDGLIGAVDAAWEQPTAYFSALAEQTRELTLVLDTDGTVQLVSPAWADLAGVNERPVGLHLRDMLHPDDIQSVGVIIAQAITMNGATLPIEFRARKVGGSWHRVEGTVRSLLSHPIVDGVVLAVQDVTAQRDVEAGRAYERLHDPLTGLPNRTLFLDRLVHVLHRTNRPGERMFAVLVVDVDRFKTINDSIGHTAGDQILVALASRLEGCLRSGDTAARLGDDEFGILLEELDDWNSARRIADRIQEMCHTPFVFEGQDVYISASIGITLGVSTYEHAEDLLRDATIAMFRAKVLGRARYEVFDPAMHTWATTQLRLEGELRRALERQELVLYYQPIVSLTTGAILGVEALLRWRHPTRGLVSPAAFIPTAEETGLIVPIGDWVLRTACRQVKKWQAEGHPALQISVNLSARQFRRKDVAKLVAQVLEETNLQPHCLELELTESIFMEDAESAIETLQELRSLGVSLALDDFGTGYSSLSYLKRFPLSSLKIDGSFMHDLNTNMSDATIVMAIIAMSHHLKLRVVAEHVEHEAQLEFLRANQCDAYQGFLCSPPLPAEELTAFLERDPMP